MFTADFIGLHVYMFSPCTCTHGCIHKIIGTQDDAQTSLRPVQSDLCGSLAMVPKEQKVAPIGPGESSPQWKSALFFHKGLDITSVWGFSCFPILRQICSATIA